MPTLPNNLRQLQPFVDDYQRQQDAANQANESRYGQLLRTARRGGAGERRLVRRDFADNWGNIQQDAIGRGIFNTSYLDSARNRNMESQEVALNQSRQNQRNTVMGIIERRTDQQPNSNLLMSLLQGASAGIGQQEGLSGAGAGRSYSFAGVNPTRFSTGGSNMFSPEAGGGGGGGGSDGGNQPVNFGAVGGGGQGYGVGTGRNTGIGFNPGRGDYVAGSARDPYWANRSRDIANARASGRSIYV